MAKSKRDNTGAFFKPFPTNLRKLLENEKQDDVGKAIGKSRQAIGQYSRGDTQPDTDTLRLIADHFGVSVDWLLHDQNEPVPKSIDADKGAAMKYTGLDEAAIDAVKEIASSNREVFQLLLCSPVLKECMERVEWVKRQMIDPEGYRYVLYPVFDEYDIGTDYPILDKDGSKYYIYKHDFFDLTIRQAFEYLIKDYKESILDDVRQYYKDSDDK